MKQVAFANRVIEVLKDDKAVIGLAVAGSWLTSELDEFSDLDLLLITKEKVSVDKNKMLDYAHRFGKLLTGFTGEHVGEPRLLICLFDNPLLHVDIKFLTLVECKQRIEQPIILLDTDDQIQQVFSHMPYSFPLPDYQWIEDRFWVWIHYALLKIGRGELVEAFDFLGFLRMVVLGPLLHIKNNNLPRGVRKLEALVSDEDFALVRATLPQYSRMSLVHSLDNAVIFYRQLRTATFTAGIQLQLEAEEKVMEYLAHIKQHV